MKKKQKQETQGEQVAQMQGEQKTQTGSKKALEFLPMYPLLERLKAYGLEETGVNSWRSLCPCHNDKNPSFYIKLEGNKFICHCFACDANGGTVCNALGLPEQALFADYTGEAERPFALEAQKVTPHNAQGGNSSN